jgi:hypothetical protein
VARRIELENNALKLNEWRKQSKIRFRVIIPSSSRVSRKDNFQVWKHESALAWGAVATEQTAGVWRKEIPLHQIG